MSDYITRADGFAHIEKDPDASITYTQDWTAWMAKCGVTTISSCTVVADNGLTLVGALTVSAGLVAQRISGGTAGRSYKVRWRPVFNTGESDDRTIVLDVKDR